MRMVIRGGQSFASYPPGADAQPADPLLRDDRDDVGHALPAGDATLLHEDQPEQAGLAQRILDHGPAAASERGDDVDVQGADPGALTLPATTVRTAASASVNDAAIFAGTTPLMACRRRRSSETRRSGERGRLEALGRPRAGLDGDAVRSRVAKVALRPCRTSLMASASVSASWPSAWARHVRRAISSTAWVFSAAAAAAAN